MDTDSAILILEGYMLALILGKDSSYYIYDSHSRDCNGMPIENGTAVLTNLSDLTEVVNFVLSLSSHLTIECFEIVPVKLQRIISSSNDIDSLSTNMRNNHDVQCSHTLTDIPVQVSYTDLSATQNRPNNVNVESSNDNDAQARPHRKKIGTNEINNNNNNLQQTVKEGHKTVDNLHCKRKFEEQSETNRLEKQRLYRKQKRSQESHNERQKRLETMKLYMKKKIITETQNQRDYRLKKKRLWKKQKQTVETPIERQNRLDNSKRKTIEKDDNCKQSKRRRLSQEPACNYKSQAEYLKEYDIVNNGHIHEQRWATKQFN